MEFIKQNAEYVITPISDKPRPHSQNDGRSTEANGTNY